MTPKVTKTAVDPLRDELATLDSNARGEALYGRFCSGCHSGDGSGGIGPNIAEGAVAAFVVLVLKVELLSMFGKRAGERSPQTDGKPTPD